MALRTCRVICNDLNGIEHAVEVTADSLYEAVAQGLRVFRHADSVGAIGHGLSRIRVIVKQPEVEHVVLVRDFEKWLASAGRSPVEMSLKTRLRELLSK